MKNIIKYIFLTAIRDKLILGILLGILGIFAVSSLMGYTATNEQAIMQLVVFSGATRVLIIVGIIIFISFHISKSFENKELAFILSKNISREKFILSYLLGFNIIGQILLIPVIIIMLLFNKPHLLGSFQWIFSVSFELMILITFTFAVSLIMQNSIISVLASFGFYLLSRMMGFFVGLLYINFDNGVINFLANFGSLLSKWISSIVPRLDLFGQTTWLVYGQNNKLICIILLQTIIYVSLLFLIAFYDFRKKQL